MTAVERADGSWADVVGEGRLPRFILICLGVWLHAADSLVTATIMPSVGADLGGYAYFGWATAGYLLGSVIAGASSGLLALRFGLRRATAWSAVLYAVGCALSAAAPDMLTFLVGRMLQGIGGGWIAGFVSVAIGLMFADRLLPQSLRRYDFGVGCWQRWLGRSRRSVRRMPARGAGSSGCSLCRASVSPSLRLAMLPQRERGHEPIAVAWPQLSHR